MNVLRKHLNFRLIKYFSEIYEATVAIVFFGSIVTVCTAMSFLQLEIVQYLVCSFVFGSKELILIKMFMNIFR